MPTKITVITTPKGVTLQVDTPGLKTMIHLCHICEEKVRSTLRMKIPEDRRGATPTLVILDESPYIPPDKVEETIKKIANLPPGRETGRDAFKREYECDFLSVIPETPPKLEKDGWNVVYIGLSPGGLLAIYMGIIFLLWVLIK